MSETQSSFGLGFRPQHYGWVTSHCPSEVDVFEIVSENFMGVGGRPQFFLEKLRENYPIIMHGVGLSIGSAGPLDPQYLKQLKALTNFVQPKLISDHLSWGQLGRRNSHDLLPIAFTHESMNDLVGKLGYLQEFLGRRFYLENASAYVAFQDGDYDEAGFFAELLKRTGAGILLDVNNLYVNLKNLGQNPEDFLRVLKPDDIGYFHLAGHSDQGDVLVDTHDQAVPDSVWSLYKKANALFPNRPAIVEWDGNIPEFPILLEECEKARRFAAQPLSSSETILKPESYALTSPLRNNSQNYQEFFDQIVKPHGIDTENLHILKSDRPVPAAVGLKVYNHAYFLRLEEVLLDTFPGLAFITEEEGFRYLVSAYLEAIPPVGSGLKTVSENLPRFLKDPDSEVDYDFGVPLNVLGDLAALEWARAAAFTAPSDFELLNQETLQSFTPEQWETTRFRGARSLQLVPCLYDVLPVLQAIDKEESPEPPDEAELTYAVYRQKDFGIVERVLDDSERKMLLALSEGVTLLGLCDTLRADGPKYYGTEDITFVAGKIVGWAGMGLIGSEV